MQCALGWVFGALGPGERVQQEGERAKGAKIRDRLICLSTTISVYFFLTIHLSHLLCIHLCLATSRHHHHHAVHRLSALGAFTHRYRCPKRLSIETLSPTIYIFESVWGRWGFFSPRGTRFEQMRRLNARTVSVTLPHLSLLNSTRSNPIQIEIQSST